MKKYNNASLRTAEKLLKSRYHEIRFFAPLLLVDRFFRASADEQEKIYQFYLADTQYINNWDLVDSSAPEVIGGYLDGRDKIILYELAESALLWERRIAIMATFYFIKQNQFTDVLKLAKLLLTDEEDMIHKAVGWMLREIGKRDKAREVAFLNRHRQTMPRTMLRYAIKKISKIERQKYLNGTV